MIWLVLGWVLIGLLILCIELGWIAAIGQAKDTGAGVVLGIVWVGVHLSALLIGGWLLIDKGLSQVG